MSGPTLRPANYGNAIFSGPVVSAIPLTIYSCDGWSRAGGGLQYSKTTAQGTLKPLQQLQDDPLDPIEIQTETSSPTIAATPEAKIAAANRDRVLLTRAFGILICLVGIVNMVPSYLFWSRWSQQIAAPPLPQWVYWQVFVAALCLVYAVFLWQIADWSALQSVSIVMLIMAMGYGLITVSLILGEAQSPAARWLSLDGQTLERGKTWCATMLCVATLISYLGGRESSKWKRANHLMDKINSDRQTGKITS